MNRRGASLSHGVNRTPRSSAFSQGTPMPTRVTRSAGSIAARHPQPSLAALMDSPTRRNMPHLHPQRLKGGLWFDTDDCIENDIIAAWQADFWGQWWNYNMIPQNTNDAWWSSFVQKYYWDSEHQDAVFDCWKHLCQESIGKLFCKRKRLGKKLTDEMIKKSKTALENCISDGSLVEKQATALVTAAEILATQQSTSDESDTESEAGSTATGPSRHQPNTAYFETTAPYKECINGLGSIPYHNVDLNKLGATPLYRDLDMGMRLTRMEEIMEALKLDFEALKRDSETLKPYFEELKRDMKELKRGVDAILRVLGVDPVTLQPMGPSATLTEKNTTSIANPTP